MERRILATILVVVFSLCIPTLSIYLYDVSAAEGNLHPFRMTFQNLDEENAISDYGDELDRCESNGFLDAVIMQATLFGQSPSSFLKQILCIQKALVLRC